MARFIDVVERMEKFNLGALLAGDKLNVVHQKEIDIAVLVAEFLRFAFLDGLDHLVGEIVTLDIGNLLFRKAFPDGVADRPEQVGLSKAGIAVNKKRIIVLSGVFGNGDRGGVCKLVGVADNEIVKGVSGHFRKIVVFRRCLFFILLIPDENQKVKVTGEQIGQIRNNNGGKSL